MMLLGWLGFIGALFSAGCIIFIAASDPRRRGVAARHRLRWLVTSAAFAPGLALAIGGRWSDFLIWVGMAAILGWGIAALASRNFKQRADLQ
jgi:hypothetical protein